MKYNEKFMKFIYLNGMSRLPMKGWTIFINHHCAECGVVHEIVRSKFEWATNRFGDNPMMTSKPLEILSKNNGKANEFVIRHGKTGLEMRGTIGIAFADMIMSSTNVDANCPLHIYVTLNYGQ
jgi:hypothetical protein